MRRREFLQHLLWGGAVLAGCSPIDAERLAAAASGQVDRRLVDNLHVVADSYARQMHQGVPRDLLPQVQRHLAYVQSILRGRRPVGEEGRLHLIAATLAAVAGRLSFYLGNQGDAHTSYVAAEGHAYQSGDGPLRAYVLGQRSSLYSDLWRDHHSAGSSVPLQLLDEAHAAARGDSSPWLRTWLAVRRAEEHATRGDAQAAHRDLEEAGRFFGAATSTDDAFFAHWHESPDALLGGYRGNCMQLLGRTAEAAGTIEDALSALIPSMVSVRCSILVDLAMAYAKEEEVERTCELLATSLDLCSDGGLVAHIRRVVGVRQHLAPWHDTSPVRYLDERLHALT